MMIATRLYLPPTVVFPLPIFGPPKIMKKVARKLHVICILYIGLSRTGLDRRTTGPPDLPILRQAPMRILSVVWRRYRHGSKAHDDSYQILMSNPTFELSPHNGFSSSPYLVPPKSKKDRTQIACHMYFIHWAEPDQAGPLGHLTAGPSDPSPGTNANPINRMETLSVRIESR